MENNILSMLYRAFEATQVCEKEHTILRESESILDPLCQKLSSKEWDTLWDTARRSARADGEDCFIRGFRLGVQLVLAGLEPIERVAI